MSDTCPTVMIVTPSGPARINESDFDPAKHELFVERDPAAPIGTDSGDQFSDDQLRAIIKDVTGKAPHHKAGREKLIGQFNELNAATAAQAEE